MFARRSVSILVFCCFLLAACAPAHQITAVAPASQAAIAMPDRYGADVAEFVLRAGGNAVDAAVAACDFGGKIPLGLGYSLKPSWVSGPGTKPSSIWKEWYDDERNASGSLNSQVRSMT